MDLEFSHPRFSNPTAIGAGQFGDVLKAYDRDLGRDVAIKVLRPSGVEDSGNLKQEFRVLRRIVHPGVVRFHELFTDSGTWFYSMDLVDGCPADQWWANHRDDRSLLRLGHQLLATVEAIHRAGTLHRDIKPSNLLVDREGRLTVVDFGFARDLARPSQWEKGGASGTFAYMAPEAFAGSVSPACDWYSVGAVLFEMLTGTLPSPIATPKETAEAILARGGVDPAIAADLVGLLSRNPEPRLAAARSLSAHIGALDIAAPGGEARPGAWTQDTTAGPFVGRDAEMEVLLDCLDRARRSRVVCHVHGPSGIGKSELIARFLADAMSRRSVVLQGRCHTTEHVPYNALDEAVDDLARFLDSRTLRAEWTLPRDEESRAAAATLFPVLRRFEGFQGSVHPEASPQRLRRLGLDVVRSLLGDIASTAPLIIALDDVHWGDSESSALLSALLQGGPPLLLLLSYRSPDAQDGPFVPALDLEGMDQVEIALGPLAREAVVDWVATLDEGTRRDETLRFLDDHAEGSPFLVRELIRRVRDDETRALPSDYTDILTDRLGHLREEERLLLEAASIAGRPTDCEILASAVGQGGTGRLLAEHLAARALLRLRTTERGVEAIAYHDRIREAVDAGIPDSHRRLLHGGLASAFEARPDPDPERLFVHFAGAGERGKAGHYGEAAARRASDALAFRRAADLLEEVLRLTDDDEDRVRRLAGLGDACVNAGHGHNGALRYREAANLAGALPPTALRDPALSRRNLLRRAAQHLVRSGRMLEGKAIFAGVLDELGVRMPPSTRAAMREALLKRLRFFLRGWQCDPAERSDLPDDVRDRLDMLWDASVCFALTNFPFSHALGSSHLLEALERGDRWSVMRSVGVEAAFESAIGTNFLRKRAGRMLDFIDTLVRPEIDDVFWQQAVRVFRAVAYWNQGRWQESADIASDYAQRVQRYCPGSDWEIAVAHLHWFAALGYMGEMRVLAERMPAALEDAMARGDDFGANFYRLGEQALYVLANDDPTRLRQMIDTAKSSWPDEPHHTHHYHHVIIGTYLPLYEQDAGAAWDFIRERWSMLREAQYLSIEIGRVVFHHLRGRAALAAAAALHNRETRERDPKVRELLTDAAKCAKVVRRAGIAPAKPFATQLEAGIARLRGDTTTADTLRATASREFRAIAMPLYAAACDLRWGDERERQHAETVFHDQGVRRPREFASTLAPG